MKILIVSLLRLGDLIQQMPLLVALRAKRPDAEIHFLINKPFANFADLLAASEPAHSPGSLKCNPVRFHYFDRELLQRSMGESSFNLFSCLDILDETLQELNDCKFDQVLNWTHTRLSAYLIGTLDIPLKLGLHQSLGRIQGLESPWLQYFNDTMAGSTVSHFHYVELLAQAFELPIQAYPLNSQHNLSRQIYLQCLTSDAKKNWPLENFRQLKNLLKAADASLSVRVLCAPNEYSKLLAHFSTNELQVCTLVQARELLKQARLLITLDTSIKHLAAQVGTPVLELAFGGSDSIKTSAFTTEQEVLIPQTPCYPCTHSQKCSQLSHLCAESIGVDQVLAQTLSLLKGERGSDQDLPATKQMAGATTKNAIRSFERLVWASYLQSGLRPSFVQELPPGFDFYYREELVKATQILCGYQESFESCENFNEIFATLQVIREKGLDVGAYFQKLSQVFSDRFASAEAAFQALKVGLQQSGDLLSIRKNLIETLIPAGGTHADRN